MNDQNNFNGLNNQNELNNNQLNQGPITLNNLTSSEPEMLNSEVNGISQVSDNNLDLNQSMTNNGLNSNFGQNISMEQPNINNSFNQELNQFNNDLPPADSNNLETLQTNNSEINLKQKTITKLIIIIVSLVALVTAGILVVSKLLKPKDKNSEIISTTFFIENENGMSAVFSIEGEQLTDFEYQLESNIYANSDFVNHAINVKNVEGEVGVINDKGKVVIDFGKFDTITRVGGLYEVTDKDLNQFLYDSSGKKIRSLDLFSIIKHGDLYVITSSDDKYELINYDGKVILTLEKLGDEKPKAEIEGENLSLYYNGKNYIVNVVSGKIISEFDANEPYCIHDAKANDSDSFILSKCGNLYSGYDDVSSYKIIKDGKLVKEQNEYECGKIFYSSSNLQEDDDYIFCQGNKYKFMDDEGKVLVENDNEIAFIDKNNYALFTEDSYDSQIIKIYKEGQLVKELENTSGYGFDGYYLYPLNNNYIFYSHEDFNDSMDYIGGVRFYDKNGDVISKKYYKAVDDYDSNGFAYVWLDDGSALINEKEEIVTDFFEKKFESFKNYYIANNFDNITIFNNKLEIILDNCTKVGSAETPMGLLYLLKKDNKYYVFNTENQKIIYTTDKELHLNSKYMYTYENDEKVYYSYKTLKEFYSEK